MPGPIPSHDALLTTIGERLAAHRLAHNLTQRQLAEQAGLGLRTVQRLEAGEAATHLSGFLRVCSTLGLLGNIDTLVPEPPASPMAQLKSQQQQQRRRATRKTAPASLKKKWTWADQS